MIGFFKKKKKITLSIQELRPFFFKTIQTKLRESQSVYEKHREEIKKSLHALKEAILQLQSKEDESKSAKHIKEHFVVSSLSALHNIEEIKDIYEFYASLEKALSKIENLSPREVLRLKMYYENEMSRIVNCIKELRKHMDLLYRILYTGIMKDKERITHLLDELDEIRKEINEKKERIAEIDENIEKIKTEIKERQKELKEIKIEEPKYEHLLEEKKQLEARLLTSLSVTEKLVKKYAHETNEKINLYELFLKDDEKAKRIIISAIAYARKGIISIDEHSIEKVEELISEWERLKETKKELNKIEHKIAELIKREEELKPLKERKKNLLLKWNHCKRISRN